MEKWNSKGLSRSSVSASRPILPTPVRSPEALSALAQARAELNSSSSSSSSSSSPVRDENNSRFHSASSPNQQTTNESDVPAHVGEAMRRLRSAYRVRKGVSGDAPAISPPNSPRSVLAKYTASSSSTSAPNNDVTNIANEIKFVRFENEISELKRLRNEAAAHVDVLQADLQIANNRIDELRGELTKAGVHFEEKKLEFGSSIEELHTKVALAHAEKKRRTEMAMVALVFLRAEKKREREAFAQREAALNEALVASDAAWRAKYAALENTLKKEKISASESLAELQGLYTEKSNNANDYHVRAEAAEGRLARVETDLTHTRQYLASERETTAQLNEEVSTLEKARSTLENELRHSNEKLSELRKDFFALKSSTSAKIADLEKHQQDSKDTIEDLKRALGENHVKLSSEKAAVEWAQARAAEFQSEARDLRAEISKHEARVSGAAKEVESLRKELKTIEYELQDERARVKSLTETIERSTHTFELEVTINELRTEVSILQADRDRQLEKAGGMLLAVHAAEKRIADAKSEAEASANEMLREVQATSSARVREAQVEVMILKDKVNEERNHARNLEKELNTLKQRLGMQSLLQQQQQQQGSNVRPTPYQQQSSGTPGSPATQRNSQRPHVASSALPVARALPVVATNIEASPREPPSTATVLPILPPSLPPPSLLPPPSSSSSSANHSNPVPLTSSAPVIPSSSKVHS
jgi:predicted  nucleic acid-binding Zn-ribbon protein